MSEMSISWGELAQLTHDTQVAQFGFCSCEEQEYFPYEDCPKEAIMLDENWCVEHYTYFLKDEGCQTCKYEEA
jgi:hypothetical protein